ncbi:MAG: hypothetical protein J5509_07055 [Lachnospiraceae bacterium]|nr:hypothetical protein [Lachnospiraceae bacterium]
MTEGRVKKIYKWEPWFFIFFGLFHLHRIWALIDRESYASFWLGIMNCKGLTYFLMMGLLSVLCILGIVTFLLERGRNFWWRLIYLCGGAYLLFDLFAIATGLEFWKKLLDKMFDTQSAYWNLIWGFFILLGGLVTALGIILLRKTKNENDI